MTDHILVSTPPHVQLGGSSSNNLNAYTDAHDIGGWQAVVDETTGEMYYWDPASGVTSWEPPIFNASQEDDSPTSENSFTIVKSNRNDRTFISQSLIPQEPGNTSQNLEQAIDRLLPAESASVHLSVLLIIRTESYRMA